MKHLSVIVGLLLLFGAILSSAENVNKNGEKSAESYLQEGHKKNRNGDIEEAIRLYEKSLSVNPE